MPTLPLTGFGDLDVLDFLFFCLMGFSLFFYKKKKPLPSWVKILSWVFFVWLFLSVVQGFFFHGNSLNNAMRELTVLLNYFLFIPVFYLVNSERQKALLLEIVLWIGFAMGVLGISVFFLGDIITLGGYPVACMHLVSWRGFPRLLQLLGFGFILFAFHYGFFYIIQRRSILNIKILIGFFVSIFAIIITFGRTSLVAFVFSLSIGIYLLLKDQKFKHKLLITESLLGLLMAMITSVIFMSRFFGGEDFLSALIDRGDLLFKEIEYESGNWGSRLFEYDMIMKNISENPFLGKGLGYTFFIGFFGQFFSHNGFLELTGKLGVPGLIIFLLFFWAFFLFGLGLIRDKEKQLPINERILIVTCLSYLIFVSVKSFAANMFCLQVDIILISIIFGLILMSRRKAHLLADQRENP